MGTPLLRAASLLLLLAPAAEALGQRDLCYVLDAILFLYAFTLTVLYCRLKLLLHRAAQREAAKEKEEAIYSVLSGECQQQPYETLQLKRS